MKNPGGGRRTGVDEENTMSSTKVYSTGEGAVAGGRRSTRPPWIWKRPFAAITDHLPLRRPFDARWASNRLDLIRIGPSGAGGGGTAVGGEAPGNRSTAPSHLVVGTIPETGGNPLFLKRGGGFRGGALPRTEVSCRAVPISVPFGTRHFVPTNARRQLAQNSGALFFGSLSRASNRGPRCRSMPSGSHGARRTRSLR